MKNSAILICFLVSALFLMTGGIAVADGHINVDIEEETAEFDGDEFSVDWGFCLDKEKQGDFYPVDVRVSWTVIIDCCG